MTKIKDMNITGQTAYNIVIGSMILLNTGVLIVSLTMASGAVRKIEADISANSAKIETNTQMRDMLIKLNENVSSLIKSVDRLASSSEAVAMEQQRRSPIIDQAQKYMIDNPINLLRGRK